MSSPMFSNRPYMIRATYEWICDNQCTPYISVDTKVKGVVAPKEFVQPDGHIILDIQPSAIKDLVLGNQEIDFSARFDSYSFHIIVPLAAVKAIYAKETGRGMVFAENDKEPLPPPRKGERGAERPAASRANHLRVVRDDEEKEES